MFRLVALKGPTDRRNQKSGELSSSSIVAWPSWLDALYATVIGRIIT